MSGTKRERLLDWIRNGDPDDVPVLMGPTGFEVASAKLAKDQHEITWTDAIEVTKATGTHLLACIGMPGPLNVAPLLDDFKCDEINDMLEDGTPRKTRIFKTPEGTLSDVQEFPKDKGAYHRRFLVNGPEDLPAFASLIRKSADAVINNPAARKHIFEDMKKIKDEINGELPILLWPFIAGVELTCSLYMDQMTAIFALHDQKDLMEELMDIHWEMTKVWLELGEQLEVDIYGYAINGLEWLSVDLYERYMIPQAKRLNEAVAGQGSLSWIHTCGKLKKLVEMKVYQQMKVDVLESFTLPPTGDIENLAETRSLVGDKIATRGGINCELLYESDLDMLRERTEHVMDSVKGYKHMIGDTNASYPSYPWEDIEAVIDVVRKSGRLYE